ncbi:SLC13 family permease [Desulfotruncus alcoholivorax]|uniref:SLC13 family permease n=1 Tax=Desulfotruncus alcoholivorax TaxID=265477 RepID=UPI000429080F|nr:SLC13 family permease [Desulfotruncus alcoholivorax]
MNNTTQATVGAPVEVSKINNLSEEWRRIAFALLGIGLFALFYFLPQLPSAVDPSGKVFELSRQAQLAIGLFLLAGIWWVFEVVPIGVTSIAIGVIQAAFSIRGAKEAFAPFMDTSVLFILGSLLLGLAFTKAGVTTRLAFKMLSIAGEDSRKILLGVFLVTTALTHLMAHTAVAAAMFPLMLVILSLYGKEDEPSNFGKAMFIGMAYAAGAGSMITLLGASRGPVALGFFQQFTGNTVGFMQYSLIMAPFGYFMVIVTWFLLCYVFYKPEKKQVAGLRKKVDEMYAQLGPMSGKEIFVIVLALAVITVLAVQQFVPALKDMNRCIPMLVAVLIMFLTKLFTVEDLEKNVPWNIVLLFGGAMSIGTVLWETGAAEWMAVHWLAMFQNAHWLVFVTAIAFLVIILTNFIMNVAAIAITLPVALVIAGYLHVNPYLILFTSLAMAALPYMLLVGAAPNAIAYQSKQFTPGQFFMVGIPFTVLALVTVAIFALVVWPLMGIPALVP